MSILAPGAIRLTGRDVLGLLQNISTQRLADLGPGEARLTLFCEFRARLIHRAVVARAVNGSIWLIREDAPGESLAAHVDRNVFREDVKIEDVSREWNVRPSFQGNSSVPGSSPAGHPGHGVVRETDGRIERIEVEGCPSYTIAPAVSGAVADGAVLDLAAWERERIERGWARHGHEIMDAFNPFDVNLGHGVHLDKGCFTGQETLMRIVTRGSVRNRLVNVSGSGTPVCPSDITDEAGHPVGRLTSLVRSGEGWDGLAVIKREIAEANSPLVIEGVGEIRRTHVFPLLQPGGRTLRTT
jgi:folate-binding protein YgfZ